MPHSLFLVLAGCSDSDYGPSKAQSASLNRFRKIVIIGRSVGSNARINEWIEWMGGWRRMWWSDCWPPQENNGRLAALRRLAGNDSALFSLGLVRRLVRIGLVGRRPAIPARFNPSIKDAPNHFWAFEKRILPRKQKYETCAFLALESIKAFLHILVVHFLKWQN